MHLHEAPLEESGSTYVEKPMLRVSDGAGGQFTSNDDNRCLCKQPFQAGEVAQRQRHLLQTT